MAATTQKQGTAKREAPKGFVNLSARYPKYDPGVDGRKKENVGAFGAVVHGYALGTLNMPETIPDPVTGELKPWDVLVVELLEPCPAYLEEDGVQMRPAGSCIIMTITTALESAIGRNRLAPVLESSEKVARIFIQPQVSKTKAGLSLWTYPTFAVDPRLENRKPSQIVSLAGAAFAQLASGQENGTGIRPALPAHAAAG